MSMKKITVVVFSAVMLLAGCKGNKQDKEAQARIKALEDQIASNAQMFAQLNAIDTSTANPTSDAKVKLGHM